MKFNEKLVELRKKKGISQEELGNLLDVTRQTVSKWELGDTAPDMTKLNDISKVFGVTLDELVNEKPIEDNVKKDVQFNVVEQSTNTIEGNSNNNNNSSNINSGNKSNKNNTRKIIIIVLIIILVSIIPFIMLGTFMYKIFKFPMDMGSSIFNKVEDIITNVEDNMDYCNHKGNIDSDVSVNKNINKDVNSNKNSNTNINNTYTETNTFSKKNEENYNGINCDDKVIEKLDFVINNNKTNNNKIKVIFNGMDYNDLDSIINLKNSVNGFNNCKIVTEYKTNDSISLITIEAK